MSARRRRVLLDIGGNSAEARREVRDVRDELRRLGREEVEARVDINERVVLAKIEKVKQRIDRLKGQEASVDVDVKLAGAYAQLDRLNLRLDRLKTKRINIDVDVQRGGLERVVAGLEGVQRGTRGVGLGFANIFHQIPILGGLLESVLGGGFTLAQNLGTALGGLATRGISALIGGLGSLGNLAGPIGAVGGQIVSLGLSLLTLGAVAGAVVIALNAILGAIIALSGALVALVASAAAAAAGLGAIAVAFGAVLIPVALVAFGVFQRFTAILKAHQAQQQELAAATQNAKQAEQAHVDALRQRQRAEEQLAQATVAGRKAMAQAAVDERDAELGLRTAKTGVEDARLALALAKRDLKDFLVQAGATGRGLEHLQKQFTDVHVDPSKLQGVLGSVGAGGPTKKIDPLDLRQKIQAIRDAQDGVANATNRVTHAEDDLAAARQKEADFARRGIRAYGPYRQALQAVETANRRVARTSEQSSAAQRKADQALKALSTTEQGTLTRLNGLIDGFTRLAKAVTDPIFKALNAVFDSLKGKAGEFEAGLRLVGEAMADVVRALGAFLTEPATLSAFQTMAVGAAGLVRELGAKAFVSFLTIMREIAVAALPAVQAAARGVSGWLGRIAGQPGKIRGAVGTVIDQFKTWARFAGAVVRLVLALFQGAAPEGKSLADSMTRIVNRWTAWLKTDAGQRKVRQFFRDAVEKTKDIARQLRRVYLWLRDNLPEAAGKAKHAFETVAKVLKPLLTLVDELLNKLSGSILEKLVLPLAPKGSSGGVKPAPKPPPGFHWNLDTHKLERDDPAPPRGPKSVVRTASFEPGELKLKRLVVQQLALPVMAALKSPATPAMAGIASAGDVHHHYHVPRPASGGPVDPRSTLEHINTLIDLKV